jgi:hypothetical protein
MILHEGWWQILLVFPHILYIAYRTALIEAYK